MFEELGYTRNRDDPNDLVLTTAPDPLAVLQTALVCYIASMEIEIYISIYSHVRRDGFTERDVMEARMKCADSEKNCKLWIHDNCEATRPKILKEPEVREKVATRSMTNRKAKDETRLNGAAKAPPIPKRNNNIPPSFVKDLPATSSHAPKPARSDATQHSDYREVRSKHDDIPFIDAAALDDPATLDEHVQQSLLLVDKQPLPDVNNASAQSQSHGSEWHEVFQSVHSLGPSYYDPGGRGDILKGERMVPRDDTDSENEFPPPPTPEQLAQLNRTPRHDPPSYNRDALTYDPNKYLVTPANYASAGARPKVSNTSVVLSPMNATHGSSSNTRDRPRLTPQSTHNSSLTASSIVSPQQLEDLYSPTSTALARHNNLLGASQITPTSVDPSAAFSQKHQHFSTFLSSDPTPVARNSARTSVIQEPHSLPYSRDLNDPDYADMRRVSPRGGGKPSFEQNFQSTSQRLYQLPNDTKTRSNLPKSTSADSNYASTRKSNVINNNKQQTQTRKAASKSIAQAQVKSNHTPGSSRQWQCEQCTFINSSTDASCTVCEKGRDSNPKAFSVCPKCTFENKPNQNFCEACQENLKLH